MRYDGKYDSELALAVELEAIYQAWKQATNAPQDRRQWSRMLDHTYYSVWFSRKVDGLTWLREWFKKLENVKGPIIVV